MTESIPPRLHWSCRRGMLELDVLLGNFLAEAYLSLEPKNQALFIKLLDCEDQDLFMWLTGKAVPEDKDIVEIVNQVRQHAKTRNSAARL